MLTICQIDATNVYVQHREIEDWDEIPAGWIITDPPKNLNVINLWQGEWIELDEAPVLPPVEVSKNPRISRLELRRLLKPKEAQWFDEAEETSVPLTAEERDEVFDLNTTNADLQYRSALRDALMQWRLLDQGVIEMDHPDTAVFLMVLGANGMFGGEAHIRIPKILAQEAP